MEKGPHHEIAPKQESFRLTESEKTYLATKFMQILDRIDDKIIPEYLGEHVNPADDVVINHIARVKQDIVFHTFQDLCKLFGVSDADIKKAMGGPGSVPGHERLKSLLAEEEE